MADAPDPPRTPDDGHVVAAQAPVHGRSSPIGVVVGMGILLAVVVGLGVIGSQPPPGPTAVSSASTAASPNSTTSPRPSAPRDATTLRGRIVDADRRPVSAATVHVYPRPERGLVAGSAVTDADGRWALTLPSGNTYCLELNLVIPSPGGSAGTEWWTLYEVPGITRPVDSWPCVNQVGDVVLDAMLPSMRLVSGTVVDQAGRPLALTDAGGPFTRIDLTVSSRSAGSTSLASEDGRFSIWVPEGSWTMLAWAFSDAQAAVSAVLPLDVRAAPVTDVQIEVDTSSLLGD